MVSAIQGFTGGGAVGGISQDVAGVVRQVGQGDVDTALARSVVSVTGLIMPGIPSSQINKFLRATEERDPEWYEFMTGPRQH